MNSKLPELKQDKTPSVKADGQDKVVKTVTFDGNEPKYRDLNNKMRTYQPNNSLKFD